MSVCPRRRPHRPPTASCAAVAASRRWSVATTSSPRWSAGWPKPWPRRDTEPCADIRADRRPIRHSGSQAATPAGSHPTFAAARSTATACASPSCRGPLSSGPAHRIPRLCVRGRASRHGGRHMVRHRPAVADGRTGRGGIIDVPPALGQWQPLRRRRRIAVGVAWTNPHRMGLPEPGNAMQGETLKPLFPATTRRSGNRSDRPAPAEGEPDSSAGHAGRARARHPGGQRAAHAEEP